MYRNNQDTASRGLHYITMQVTALPILAPSSLSLSLPPSLPPSLPLSLSLSLSLSLCLSRSFIEEQQIEVVPSYLVASREVVKERAAANYIRKKVPEVATSFHNYMTKVQQRVRHKLRSNHRQFFEISNIAGNFTDLFNYDCCV